MKILVTGGTGVVGVAAIPALLRAGHEVRLLSRHAEVDAQDFPAGVEAFTADIADPEPLRSAVGGCDAVLHIAGIVEEQPPEITFAQVNVEGTRHLLAAAERAGRPDFVFLSSLGAERGSSDYHQSKRQAEELVRAYPGRWTILRPGGVYGPGDETISLLLKMVRTLPALPMVDDGDQPFQPLWYSDLGDVIAQVLDRADLGNRTLDLAGPEVTTTQDVFDRLGAITGRSPLRIPIPAWLASVGAKALEAFGAAGAKFLQRAGVGAPLNSAKLAMLLEGSVIPDASRNALHEFDLEPTSLAEGLERLADLLPEQLPGDGVGELTHTIYAAEIPGGRHSATQLMAMVGEQLTDVMPIEFAAEGKSPDDATEGATFTAAIQSRGHVQVRVVERTDRCVTFVTVEGHPLAGVLQLRADELAGGVVCFTVHTVTQSANVVDWVGMHTVGAAMQAENWRNVVRRVVALSGGAAPGGVTRRTVDNEGEQTKALMKLAEECVHRQRRAQSEQRVGEGEASGGSGN